MIRFLAYAGIVSTRDMIKGLPLKYLLAEDKPVTRKEARMPELSTNNNTNYDYLP